jgi:tRNA nucleotidyltransferase/poly(A) polymerase
MVFSSFNTIENLLERVRQALPGDRPVYLVGGAVRDAMLNRPVHDLDFSLTGNVLAVGRKVADALGAAYYPLDEARETARVVLAEPDGKRRVLDFAALRGPDLESDLRARDFTVNAMALLVHQPEELLDPTGGAADLRAKLLRACSPGAFEDDPVRILRGVRLAASLGFRLAPDTLPLMRAAVDELPRVSVERLRDELFRILDGPQPASGLEVLDRMDVLAFLLPELMASKGVSQSPPHQYDVWTHTLHVVRNLDEILNLLAADYDPQGGDSLFHGLLALRLGRYRKQIQAHLAAALNPDRSLRALLLLAAMYHDSGKPATRSRDEDGRIRFFEHERVGALLVSQRLQRLHLSNEEVERAKTIVCLHMRPLLLAQSGELPTRRAIYRFFRAAGPAGVEICLLSLADVLAISGVNLSQEQWDHHLAVVRSLLEAWWEHPEETVKPPTLVDGHELITELGLKPGPLIGQMLEAIREAQACGEVMNRDEALDLARRQAGI